MLFQSRLMSALTLASFLSGCAAPPNTPGQGIGKAYTPVIDTEGADTARYQRDLDTCRKYAGAVDEQKEALEGLITGMLYGAMASTLVGGNSYTTQRAAGVGAFSGTTHAQNTALKKQERIMINCMAGRGYRTLDGAAVAPVAYAPQTSPYAPAPVAQPATAAQPAAAPITAPPPAAFDPTGMDASHTDRVAMGYQPKEVTLAGPAVEVGKFTYQAERLPEVKSCHASPTAKLIGRGPGMESYSVACSNGDILSVRCEFGNCRVLR